MASDRSHLVRTQITDRRGRATTVYRRATPAPTGAAVPPLQIRAVSTEVLRPQPLPDSMTTWPTSGQFRSPKERTIEEIGATLEAMEGLLPDSAGRAAKSLRRENARHSTQLAMEFIEAGVLSEREALLTLSLSYPEDGGPLPAVALRVAAALRDRVRGDQPDAEWVPELVAAVRGATSNSKVGWSYAGAHTPEEVESLCAVVEFVLRSQRPSRMVRSLDRGRPDGGSSAMLMLSGQELDRVLMDRPGDLDRILAYTARHEFDPRDRGEIRKLQAHLDTDTPDALLDGYL